MSTTPARGRADYLQLGDWNALCAQCGRKRKASEMKQLPSGVAGSGLYVCPEHWDSRHPQEFVRGIPDKMAAPWTQMPQDSFVEFCDIPSISCICDLAAADCSICDYRPPNIEEYV